MSSLIEELKSEARVLHRQAQRDDAEALRRLRLAEGEAVLRRHCLAAIARELGFTGWPAAVAAIEGDQCRDFGTLLYPPGGSAHTNIWCASYEQAREIHRERGGYLLAYRTQFFLCDRYFIETIGVDPDDDDWARIGHDWARPSERQARERLYRNVIAARRRSSARC